MRCWCSAGPFGELASQAHWASAGDNWNLNDSKKISLSLGTSSFVFYFLGISVNFYLSGQKYREWYFNRVLLFKGPLMINV